MSGITTSPLSWQTKQENQHAYYTKCPLWLESSIPFSSVLVGTREHQRDRYVASVFYLFTTTQTRNTFSFNILIFIQFYLHRIKPCKKGNKIRLKGSLVSLRRASFNSFQVPWLYWERIVPRCSRICNTQCREHYTFGSWWKSSSYRR